MYVYIYIQLYICVYIYIYIYIYTYIQGHCSLRAHTPKCSLGRQFHQGFYSFTKIRNSSRFCCKRKWRHPIKSVLNYDNKGSNYRDCTSVLGYDSKGSNDRGCTSGHIYPPLTLTHPTGLVDSVFKLVYYFN